MPVRDASSGESAWGVLLVVVIFCECYNVRQTMFV